MSYGLDLALLIEYLGAAALGHFILPSAGPGLGDAGGALAYYLLTNKSKYDTMSASSQTIVLGAAAGFIYGPMLLGVDPLISAVVMGVAGYYAVKKAGKSFVPGVYDQQKWSSVSPAASS